MKLIETWEQQLEALERRRTDALNTLMAVVRQHYDQVPKEVQDAYSHCWTTMHDTLDHVRSRVTL